MPYVKNTFIEPKLFYAIVGLAVSNLIALFVMLAVLAAKPEADDTNSGAVAQCREIYPYRVDGSDDEHVCEMITQNCKAGTQVRRCLDDPTPCEEVMTSASGESNQVQACYFTPASVTATGEIYEPPPLAQLTCLDYDQRVGTQNFRCPLTPGTEDTPELSTAPILRSDAAAVICAPSETTSCSYELCCSQLRPPMTCSDTNGDGETGDVFDCRAEWRRTPDQAVPVISSYDLDPTAPCDRNAGGCTPYDCCTIPPSDTETHDTDAEEYPSNAVEAFYQGVDTRDLTLMDSKVANGYQAIFTDGCVEVGGASHCGAAVYTLAQFNAFIQQHPDRITTFGTAVEITPSGGSQRELITTMDNTDQCTVATRGGCGVVMEQYVVQQNAFSPVIRSAAVHKVEGGLITETIWYSNARGKSQRVEEFYTQMHLCGSDSPAACDELDQYVDPDYIAIFSPSGVPTDLNFRPAAVGGLQKTTPLPGDTLNLQELKDWLMQAPARCTAGSIGTAGSCQTNDRKTYDQQGNSVVEQYSRTVQDISDPNTLYDVEGISVNRFINDASTTYGGLLSHAKIVETYFYSQHADEQCSDAGRARISRAFLELIDRLSLLNPGTCPTPPAVCDTRGQYMAEFDELYWHDGDDRVGTFTAVMTSGVHTIGLGIRWQSGLNRIYDEEGFASLIQHTTASAGLGLDESGRTVHYHYCVAQEDEDLTADPQILARHWQCLTRQYISQGDNVFVQYQVYGGDRNSPVDQAPMELGGVLLTFDEEKLSQAYWFSM